MLGITRAQGSHLSVHHLLRRLFDCSAGMYIFVMTARKLVNGK